MKFEYTQKEKFHYALKRARGIPVHINISMHMKFAQKVLSIDLRVKTDEEIRLMFCNGDDIQKYSAVAEASFRCLGLRPFAEQIAAGRLLSENKLVQMQTGEGKTLAAVFPVLNNAGNGIRTHIFTANEYLAERDAVWMGY